MMAVMVRSTSPTASVNWVYQSLAIGLTLFVITDLLNLLSDRIAARYREEYE